MQREYIVLYRAQGHLTPQFLLFNPYYYNLHYTTYTYTSDESTYYRSALAGDERKIFIAGDDFRCFFIHSYYLTILVPRRFYN